jgi:hypothetical protein
MASRIRLVASQWLISANANEAGGLMFEPMTVQGVTGLGLRRARIRDLSVGAIHLKQGCVTQPVSSQLASNFGPVSSYTTFLSHSITVKGVAGQPIYVLMLYVGPGTLTSQYGSVGGRILVNGVAVPGGWIIESYGGPTPVRISQPRRVSMAAVTATGAPQAITIEYQMFGSGYINAGALAISIVMMR